MRVAIMQPYLFPYWPYIQLLSHVDVFIIFDNSQYIRRGWVNRNRICFAGQPRLITIPVGKAPRDTLIADIHFSETMESSVNNIRKTIAHAYVRSGYVGASIDLFDVTFNSRHGPMPTQPVEAFFGMLGGLKALVPIKSTIVLASEILPREGRRGAEYLIALTREVRGKTYINPIGGKALYDPNLFARSGIDLRFVASHFSSYPQASAEFIPGLSVIDMVANLSSAELAGRLTDFTLIQ